MIKLHVAVVDQTCNGTKIDEVCYILITNISLDAYSANEYCREIFNGSLAILDTQHLHDKLKPIMESLG